MTNEVQRDDVIWKSDLTVSDVESNTAGLSLVVQEYSPEGEEFGVDRFGNTFLLPYRLHFTDGRTVRISEHNMEQLMGIHGLPDTWCGRIATINITNAGHLSGGSFGDHRIAERLEVEIAIRADHN